ncbi:MAG TPA: hypothetical protein VIZ66_09165 [Sphingomicrobium sp.]
MRTRREPETDEQRGEREAIEALRRTERRSAEDKELDAAVKRSIKLHGA